MEITYEIKINQVESGEDAWVDWSEVGEEYNSGSIHLSNFPDKPIVGNIYYLTLSGSDVKNIVKKK